jgi:hypothetical protein
MDAILVKPKDSQELKLVEDILARMRISSQFITDEDKEDIGILQLMLEADRSKKVSREQIMEKLGRK